MNIKSTAIFDFLLKNFQKLIKFITQSYLFITSEFIFILKQIFCLDNYFFKWLDNKSRFRRFSVLISYNVWSANHFSISSCFPCFSGSRFFRVQVQGPGPGFRSSHSGYFIFQRKVNKNSIFTLLMIKVFDILLDPYHGSQKLRT